MASATFGFARSFTLSLIGLSPSQTTLAPLADTGVCVSEPHCQKQFTAD